MRSSDQSPAVVFTPGVPYFVADSFELYYSTPHDLHDLEDKIEQQNINGIRHRCRHERVQRQRMMEVAAHYSGDQRTAMQEQASRLPQRSCDELDRYEAMERQMGS